MARPLPGRCGGLDPLERAGPGAGSGLTRDELKALWAELGENHLNHRIGDYATDIPTGPPRPGPDPTDSKVSRVHAMLETHIRGERKTLLANLRAFPPRGTANEVWNHGIYKYIATYHAMSGRGPRAVRIVLELHGNSGSMLNGQDDTDRVVFYEYSLVYGMDGRVDESNPYAADWISVGGEAMFAPMNVLEVVESRWAGHNPYVTEANVRAMDLANNAGAFEPVVRHPADLPAGRSIRVRPPSVARQRAQRRSPDPEGRILPQPLPRAMSRPPDAAQPRSDCRLRIADSTFRIADSTCRIADSPDDRCSFRFGNL